MKSMGSLLGSWDMWDARTIASAAAIFLLLGLLVRLVWKNGRGARNAARARRLGRRGEAQAKSLLLAAGYRIVETQSSMPLTVLVDGAPLTTHLRADFILERGGRRYVADAKSGDKASSPASAATRRQLLEYATAYDVDGVLLVDAAKGKIRHIEFPSLQRRGRRQVRRALGLVAIAVVGAAAYALYI